MSHVLFNESVLPYQMRMLVVCKESNSVKLKRPTKASIEICIHRTKTVQGFIKFCFGFELPKDLNLH